MQIAVPASRKIKFKPHVGRVFTLRKNEYVDIYSTGAASSYQNKAQRVKREDVFGEAVMVIDETNTRACVNKLDGHTTWIQKFYLHKEIPSQMYAKGDMLSLAISDILDISIKLRGNMLKSEEVIEKLEEVARSLRAISDSILKG